MEIKKLNKLSYEILKETYKKLIHWEKSTIVQGILSQ